MTHDSTGEPVPLSSDDLLDLLRRIADHDDAPDTVQVDARNYLKYLSGSGRITGEARLTMAATAALWHGREVVERLPRPGRGTA